MITRDMVEKMNNAGVPSDLIVKMLLSEPEPVPALPALGDLTSPAPDVANADVPTPEEPTPQTDPSPSGVPSAGEQKPKLTPQLEPEPDPVLAAIRELTGAIQSANLINRSRDYEAPETVDTMAEKALAQILSGRK